jgi:hypothetical protein
MNIVYGIGAFLIVLVVMMWLIEKLADLAIILTIGAALLYLYNQSQYRFYEYYPEQMLFLGAILGIVVVAITIPLWPYSGIVRSWKSLPNLKDLQERVMALENERRRQR